MLELELSTFFCYDFAFLHFGFGGWYLAVEGNQQSTTTIDYKALLFLLVSVLFFCPLFGSVFFFILILG